MRLIEKYGHGGDLLTAHQVFNKASGEFLDFSANINPLGPPAKVLDLLKERLETIVHYPDPAHRVLKQKLSERNRVSDDQILIGNGAAECISLILLGLQPKTVGLIYPCFSEYEQLSVAFGAKINSCYGKLELDFKPDISELNLLLLESDLVFIGHPNNPTGVLYTMEELVQIAEQAKKTNTYLVIDEAFIDFLPKQLHITLLQKLERYRHVLIVRSMTKIYAIPGLRLGYVLAHPELIGKLQAKQVTWSVNQMALIAGEAVLNEREYEDETIALVKEQRNYVKQSIEEQLGWMVFPGQANFLLIRITDELAAAELQWKLGERGILIRSCAMYQGLTSQDFRIAIRTKKENDCLLQALKEVAHEGIQP
ncbi:threonine-phosphate decarboxylase [Bacillus sp. BRMEA1]|uniref:threonine-phosphate decarboxylase CobD n=1 Tax=Neobacillus endophyticus TaxID=2738405 RepID=UPI0015644801|nr:threonine-phosphate decarboxylase CobD [Neobacillus endophyticus]NRD79192.1 threonine-phosphate decarboxylase [Neobacillus endophyticus]